MRPPVMDRRQRKLEQKRKKREQAKKRSRLDLARRPSEAALLARAGARSELGPCFVSAGWEDGETPRLVNVVMTRKLGAGELLPHTLLLDRTCLGVKNAMLSSPMSREELDDFLAELSLGYGGIEECSPLVAQSLVFHALDYARELGFSPNRDFHEVLVGPRPAELLATPWHRPEQPVFISGPHDDVPRILAQLRRAVGDDFLFLEAASGHAGLDSPDDFALDEDDEHDDASGAADPPPRGS